MGQKKQPEFMIALICRLRVKSLGPEGVGTDRLDWLILKAEGQWNAETGPSPGVAGKVVGRYPTEEQGLEAFEAIGFDRDLSDEEWDRKYDPLIGEIR